MRYLGWTTLVFLIAVNLGVLVWHVSRTGAAPVGETPEVATQPGAARLVLLHEQPALSSGTEDGESAGEQETPLLACFNLGPFEAPEGMETAADRMAMLDVDYQKRQRETESITGYWVLLPPFADRAAATDMTVKLERDGVQDYALVRDGENKNAISLGFFRKRPGADRRLADLKQLGYKPVLEPRFVNTSRFWLYIRGVTSEAAQAILTEDFRAAQPGVRLEPTPCQ